MVLYRKYRPKTFSEIIGQEHIVKTLTNAISTGEISHAYLFSGPRGSGKTTIARLLAKAVNCETLEPVIGGGEGWDSEEVSEKINKDFQKKHEIRKKIGNKYEPCNECQSCLEINQGKSIDLIEIDAASNRGIDEIRELRDGIRFAPVRAKYKVFIIDEVHQLTKEASNALLKTLEEPPAHAIFVLATTEVHKILPTIASRCQHFDFKKLSFLEIIKKLAYIAKNEGVEIEKPALELIAKNSEGSIRDAESLLDQVMTMEDKNITAKEVEEILGLVEFTAISKFVDFIAKKDESGAIRYINELNEKGCDLLQLSKALVDYLRELLILNIDQNLLNPLISGHGEDEIKILQEQAKEFSQGGLKNALKFFIKAGNDIKYANLPQLPLELAVVEAISVTS